MTDQPSDHDAEYDEMPTSAPVLNLKFERLNRGLSTREAAEEIGVSQAVVLRAERGEALRPRHAKRIADFYGVRVTDQWPLPPESGEPTEC
jgi:transcriptional regulator with XRE-family HTH domain